MDYILLLVGFILLVKGADYFVDGASNIATKLKVPPLIIGLTIVAFGTSAPEAAVSITSSLQGQNEMAIGNVIGSNIFNILVVVGIAAMIFPLKVDRTIVKKEIPMTLLGSIILFVVAADSIFQGTEGYIISRGDGIVLLGFFSIFMYSLFTTALKARREGFDDSEQGIQDVMPLPKSGVLTIIGLIGVVIGGQMVVDYASSIASQWGMSESLIGLTIVALGTSLPELVTSVLAARKGESDIALGNVIGSNIFNIFFVLGTASVVSPLSMQGEGLIDMGIMIATVGLIFVMTLLKDTIGRTKGAVLVAGYVVYMIWLIFLK